MQSTTINSGSCSYYGYLRAKGFWHTERDAFAAAAGGPRLRGRPEADPEGMAACGQSLEGFAQMQCSVCPLRLRTPHNHLRNLPSRARAQLREKTFGTHNHGRARVVNGHKPLPAVVCCLPKLARLRRGQWAGQLPEVAGEDVRNPHDSFVCGDRACAVARKLTRKGWPLAANPWRALRKCNVRPGPSSTFAAAAKPTGRTFEWVIC